MHIHRPPITGRKVRFAIVGCGRIAANHIESIQRNADRAELVAVCDTNAEALASAVARTGARGHETLGSLLSAGGVDCVVLTTPSGLHSQQAMEVAAPMIRAWGM